MTATEEAIGGETPPSFQNCPSFLSAAVKKYAEYAA